MKTEEKNAVRNTANSEYGEVRILMYTRDLYFVSLELARFIVQKACTRRAIP